MAIETSEIRKLQPGATYMFAVRKEQAAEKPSKLDAKLRKYLGSYTVGGVSFLDVKSCDGWRHLIAAETVAHVLPH
jgi:hypothetical protein